MVLATAVSNWDKASTIIQGLGLLTIALLIVGYIVASRTQRMQHKPLLEIWSSFKDVEPGEVFNRKVEVYYGVERLLESFGKVFEKAGSKKVPEESRKEQYWFIHIHNLEHRTKL
jgi:hypothetical protein